MKTISKIGLWQRLLLVVTLSLMFLTFILGSLSLATSAQQEVATVPNQPSIVLVNGTKLIVQKRRSNGTLVDPQPFTIKGVNWSPASQCTDQSQLPQEFAKSYETDIPLMAAMGVNTIRTFWDFGTGPTATKILNTLYENNIMVIMVVDRTIADSNNITRTVNAYKNHPAILMWAVGNEWDLNRYYGQFPDTTQAAAFTNWAAQAIHSLDPNHPVASILGDIDRGSSQPLLPLPGAPNIISTKQLVNELVPHVDLWGLNIYRGATFGGLFGQWKQISTKPMFVAEFGADTYDHRINAENQAMQADFNGRLWEEIYLHLSAEWSGKPNLGGLVFEWNDEWWKNGNSCTRDVSGEINPGQPDGHNDEDWFGIVNLDRQPKQIYNRIQKNFLSNSRITTGVSITLSAFSEFYTQFFKNGAGFCYKEGGGGGGRGLNFAIIDPNTGAIEDCRNFDTWADKQAFVTMTDYVSTSGSIPEGRVILAAIADEGGFIRANGYTQPDCHTPISDPRVEMGYQALEHLGSTEIRNVGYWGSWAMIAIKGKEVLVEAQNDPNYNSPISGFCQRQSLVSTQITATIPISIVYPLMTLDLSVTKSASPSPTVGGKLTYTIIITNTGPLTATDILLTDTLPQGIISNQVSRDPSCTQTINTIICKLNTLTSGTTATFTIVVTPARTGVITNTVSVIAIEDDPSMSNNIAIEEVLVSEIKYLPLILKKK